MSQVKYWTSITFQAIIGLMFVVVLWAWAAAMSPAYAGQYDGTSWSSASSGVKVIPYDATKCEVCRAENGSAVMTQCGPPSAMQSGLPYVIFCGGSTWGAAGSAPGTTMVGPGGSIGGLIAGPNDYWTVK